MNADLSRWFVLVYGARTLLAKHGDSDMYDLVYELTAAAIPTPNGIQEMSGIRPFAGLGTWSPVQLSPGWVARVSVAELGPEDQRYLGAQIEAMDRHRRAQRSNLVLAQ